MKLIFNKSLLLVFAIAVPAIKGMEEKSPSEGHELPSYAGFTAKTPKFHVTVYKPSEKDTNQRFILFNNEIEMKYKGKKKKDFFNSNSFYCDGECFEGTDSFEVPEKERWFIEYRKEEHHIFNCQKTLSIKIEHVTKFVSGSLYIKRSIAIGGTNPDFSEIIQISPEQSESNQIVIGLLKTRLWPGCELKEWETTIDPECTIYGSD